MTHRFSIIPNSFLTLFFHFIRYFHRQFSIFFIVYCVLVFAIAIQNINESYGEVKAYRGRISVALSMQPRSAAFTPSHNTVGGTADDGDVLEDGHMDITEMNVRRDMKNVFCVPDFISGKTNKSDSTLAAKMDCNEFVIEVLLRCNAIDYDTDLEPILNVSPFFFLSQIIQSLLLISPSHLSYFLSLHYLNSLSVSLVSYTQYSISQINEPNFISQCHSLQHLRGVDIGADGLIKREVGLFPHLCSLHSPLSLCPIFVGTIFQPF